MTASERTHLERVVLVEMLAAFVVCMLTLVVLARAGRFDAPPGVWVCNDANECHRLLS